MNVAHTITAKTEAFKGQMVLNYKEQRGTKLLVELSAQGGLKKKHPSTIRLLKTLLLEL